RTRLRPAWRASLPNPPAPSISTRQSAHPGVERPLRETTSRSTDRCGRRHSSPRAEDRRQVRNRDNRETLTTTPLSRQAPTRYGWRVRGAVWRVQSAGPPPRLLAETRTCSLGRLFIHFRRMEFHHLLHKPCTVHNRR